MWGDGCIWVVDDGYLIVCGWWCGKLVSSSTVVFTGGDPLGESSSWGHLGSSASLGLPSYTYKYLFTVGLHIL